MEWYLKNEARWESRNADRTARISICLSQSRNEMTKIRIDPLIHY